MSIPAILIGLAFLMVSIAIVAEPLLSKKRLKPLNGENNSLGTKRSYKQILLTLRDLDFDYQLGIVTQSDYQQNRPILLAEAAEAYEREAPGEGDLSQLIETAVSDRRQHIDHGHSHCSGCGADLTPVDKDCPACGLSVRNICLHCEQPVRQDDKFCSSCGAQATVATGVAV